MYSASEKLKLFCIEFFAQQLPHLYQQFHPFNLFACKYEYKPQKIQMFNDWTGIERQLFNDIAINVSLNAVSPDKLGFLKIKNTQYGIHYSYVDSHQYLEQSTSLFGSLQDDGFEIHKLGRVNVDLSKFNKPVQYNNHVADASIKDIVDLCSAIPHLVKSRDDVEQFAKHFLKQEPSFNLTGSNGARVINEYRKFKAERHNT